MKGRFRRDAGQRLAVIAFLASLLCQAAPAAPAKAPLSEDRGREPWVVNIEELTLGNSDFRATKWTGRFLQMTVMKIEPGGEIGLEVHDKSDQFIRVEAGMARVLMGPSRDKLTFDRIAKDDWAIFIPAGVWHNIINKGDQPLQVYVIYAPKEHPAGTLHKTFQDSKADHDH
jgi:mannose-6-phosphate isomerase-like protein (cupin superfamily)